MKNILGVKTKIRQSIVWTTGLCLVALGGATWADSDFRNPSVYNLEQGVGLKGYDPVSIFPEGGGESLPGDSQYSLDYLGVVYFFASAENLSLFIQNPGKYEPTYGGWCAWAMVSGHKVDIQPHLFTVHGNRAHYFAAARAKRNFDQDILGHERKADSFWKKISGEEPRL